METSVSQQARTLTLRSETNLALVFALAGPGTALTLISCQASQTLSIYSKLLVLYCVCCCLASVYMGSSYEIVTICVDFDMVSLQDNAS